MFRCSNSLKFLKASTNINKTKLTGRIKQMYSTISTKITPLYMAKCFTIFAFNFMFHIHVAYKFL